MLDYQLNRGCLSDLFDLNARSGLLCSCPAAQEQDSSSNAGFTLLKPPAAPAAAHIYTPAESAPVVLPAQTPPENTSSRASGTLLDMDAYAVFLPLIQAIGMQRFAEKLRPVSLPSLLHAQPRPDPAIIPPRA